MAQPAHGSVGVSNNVATYFPEAGFVGTDTFTFAAWNGSKNSTLATGTVAVVQGPFSLVAKTLVPATYPANWAVPFTVVAQPVNVNTTPTYDWNFGDGSAPRTNQYPSHLYTVAGIYNWSVTVGVSNGGVLVSTNLNGTIIVSAPLALAVQNTGGSILLTWPQSAAAALLESSPSLGGDALWTPAPEPVLNNGGLSSVQVLNRGNLFFRLRKLP